jgi:hypothetical protein
MKRHNDRQTTVNGHHLLATLLHEAQDEGQAPVEQREPEPETIHVYPVEGGGLLFSRVPLSSEEEPPVAPLVDGDQPPSEPPPATTEKVPPVFLVFLLLLCLFLLLDNVDATLTTWLMPTVTITLTPKTERVTAQAILPLGGGPSGIPGRVLPPLTLTQSHTSQASGHGHQDATYASGTLTVYNGLLTAQVLPAGTVLTGHDGVRVATDAALTLPAAIPPQFAQASVSASAILTGRAGNIPAGDINTTLANGVLVQNSPFGGGQDARDFPLVTQADIQAGVTSLTPQLVQSARAALTAQLQAGEALVAPTCTPTVTIDPRAGSEATAVQVTVSQACQALAYAPQALTTQATRLLTMQALHTLGAGYQLMGSVQVIALTTSIPTTATPARLSLSFICQGTYVYQLSTQAQQHLKRLVAGKSRRAAWQVLATLPGMEQVRLSGVADTGQVPDDVSHIHLLILFTHPMQEET